MSPVLQALCKRVGLATAYGGVDGVPQPVSEASLVTLLAALGVDASDDEAAAASLARWEATVQAWPVVHVVRQSAPGVLPLPQGGDGPTAWRIDGERGGRWRGEGRGTVVLPHGLPLGYHTLSVDGHAACTLAVCPDRCHEPAALTAGDRWWGPVVQLYAFRSDRNWGIGDYTDLGELAATAAGAGASFVGLNPLHALFPHAPERATPYSPSNRSALNPLYIDVEAVPEFAACDDVRQLVASESYQQRLAALRRSPHVPYADVWAAKRDVLKALHAAFVRTGDGARSDAFRAFQRREAAWLRPHALFDALQAHLHAHDDTVHGWPAWPAAYRDPQSAAVAEFERSHRHDVEFFEFLQWLCDTQLAAAAARARDAGMPLGLYRDAAVGVDAAGSDTWQQPSLYAQGISVGAPPEPHNPAGQSWGLPPMRPDALRAQAYEPFIALLRANMRHAGALRLDHVMGLSRLFWVPAAAGGDGSYVAYPFADLLNLLALESVRQQCLVIGEDLGNVPPGFREALADRGVRSYGPLYFQRGSDGRMPPPDQWPLQALAVVGTHDLPTLPSWWAGNDVDTRAALGLYANDVQRAAQAAERVGERRALTQALCDAGVLDDAARIDDGDTLSMAVHDFIGRVRSQLVGVQLEDILGQLDPVNVPSTTESQHPNWRVKLGITLEALRTDPRWTGVARAVSAARRRPSAAAQPDDPLCVPTSTYRVQFHADMRFDDVTAAVPYLKALGVGHLYASPYLKARAGSRHGYDVTDPSRLNSEIGDDAAHRRLCDTLHAHGLRQLLDIVPNHMGVLQTDNPWWLDVLENGRASVHAGTFDIEWDAADPARDGKVVLPILGAPYGEVLAAGELLLRFDASDGSFAVAYHDHHLPIDPATVVELLTARPLPDDLSDDARGDTLAAIAAWRRLPPRDAGDAAVVAARQRDVPVAKAQLAAVVAAHPAVAAWVADTTARFNGAPGDAGSFDALHRLMQRQAWHVAFWRTGGDDVNYRRFFDVTDLAAVQMDRAPVFEAAHARVLAWLADGSVGGLRIDHPDGLSDPGAYFERLQRRHADVLRAAGRPVRPLYVAVEKILADGESMPADWAVHGDTGYRFSNEVNGLFVDGRRAAELDDACATFVGPQAAFDEVLRDAKRLVMSTSLAADLTRLVRQLRRIADAQRDTRDFTTPQLRAALAELAAGFTVYRTYVAGEGPSDTDRLRLTEAAATARAHLPASQHAALDFVCDVLLRAADEPDAARRAERLRFTARWQQFTAPVQAKAMEDTAFYRFHRLISLNDVGGEPDRAGWTVAAFHAANTLRAATTPHTLLGTSTHDSKRSEDVRARIDVLSEVPSSWREAVSRWSAVLHERARHADAPLDAATEYLLYQTLVGVWPLVPPDAAGLAELHDRVQACLLKSVREAKLATSWLEPSPAYEGALHRFVAQAFAPGDGTPDFLTDFTRWLQPVAWFGAWNSLSQVVLKLTSPGVPDIYHGSETWNFSLVDPDNRRPVDFAALHRLLDEATAMTLAAPDAVVADDALRDGRLKVRVTANLLALRRSEAALFRDGGYTALALTGPAAEHVIAFQREHAGRVVLVVATRLLSTLCGHDTRALRAECWRGTTVHTAAAAFAWTDAVTGARIAAGTFAEGHLTLETVLSSVPFAVLVRDADPSTEPLR